MEWIVVRLALLLCVACHNASGFIVRGRAARVTRGTHLRCNSAEVDVARVVPPTETCQCRFCNETFVSRNAMFRHMRTGDCRHVPSELVEPRMERSSLIVFLGYRLSTSLPQQLGLAVLQTLQQLLLLREEQLLGCDSTSFHQYTKILGSTQSTVTRSRPPCLGLDETIVTATAAAEDVLIVNLLTPVGLLGRSSNESDVWNDQLGTTLGERQNETSSVLALLGQQLADTVEQQFNETQVVRLHGLRRIPFTKQYLHAEQSCSQHVHHYLLPVSWLDDVPEIRTWYALNCDKPQQDRDSVPDAIRRFKNVLRATESTLATTRQTARFGGLGLRIPRYWHNYANPNLRLPPNYDAVRRIVDRARVIDFVVASGDHETKELYLVCSVTGDELLQQQVCRIIGTAVAVTRGWLPPDFIDQSLQRDTMLETVLAPSTHQYKATSRFHYAELCDQGQQLWASSDTVRMIPTEPNKQPMDSVEWMQSQLLPSIESNSSIQWLYHVRDVVAPRIRSNLLPSIRTSRGSDNQLESIKTEWNASHSPSVSPDVYERVVSLLRQLVATNQWPATSVARSQVISASDDSVPLGRSGSFTVVSESNFDCSNFVLPKANSLFPDLSTAVFELEQHLVSSATSKLRTVHLDGRVEHDDTMSDQLLVRPPSSHCAINSNAQFTPHVDSGRGLGQSLSMIVGLGGYAGGELVVEGASLDIRYQPLQFDGWKLRHWTRPFDGERFSLVWFTPEGMIPKT